LTREEQTEAARPGDHDGSVAKVDGAGGPEAAGEQSGADGQRACCECCFLCSGHAATASKARAPKPFTLSH
jgi:hypothetical protein